MPNTAAQASGRPQARSALDATGRMPWLVRWLLLAVFGAVCALVAYDVHIESVDASMRQQVAKAINLAGRQRMLSQRLALLAEQARGTDVTGAAISARLRETLDQLASDRQQLSQLPLFGKAAGQVPDIDLLAAPARRLQSALQAQDASALKDPAGDLIAAAADFLPRMERAVLSMELAAEAQHLQAAGQRHSFLVALAAFAGVLLLGSAEWIARRLAALHARIREQSDANNTLALVIELTHNAVILTDLDGRTTWVNDAFTQLTGYSSAEILGRTPGSLLQCELTDPDTRARIRSALQARRGLQVEILNKARSGRHYWLQLDIQPRFDASGQCCGFAAVETDITERRQEIDRQSALMAALPVGVVYQDNGGAVRDANPEACRILGMDVEELRGLRSIDARWNARDKHGRPMTGADHPAMQALTLAKPVLGERMRIDLPSGRRWLRVSSVPTVDTQGRVSGVVSSLLDITAYFAQRQMLALTIDGAGLGTWDWQIQTGQLTADERSAQMMGRPAERLPADVAAWKSVIHPEDRSRVHQRLKLHIADAGEPFRCELRILCGDGSWQWVMTAGSVVERGDDNQPIRMSGVLMDISERKLLESRLESAALTDSLTGLQNRGALMARLRACLARLRSDKHHGFAVLFLDFDRFKQVNDSLGHEAGDELLRQIAQRLRDTLRSSDTFGRLEDHESSVARLGGDEFVVVLEQVRQSDNAARVAQRLLDALSLPFTVAGQPIHSTASIGLALCVDPGRDAESVLRDADAAMYEAKRRGRGRWVAFSEDLHERVRQALDLEADLRRALGQNSGELHVVYQPIVDLVSGEVVSAEALVRWNHPRRGAVAPADFIPLAEDNGLISELGEMVLEAACREAVSWRQALHGAAPATVSVNLSRAQVRKGLLASRVAAILAMTGLPPQALRLEITESVAIQDETIVEALHELRALGVGLALDDFGTGHSSLASLDQFPLDCVKIDRAFVQRMLANRYQSALIKAVLDVAGSLELDVVAEGVETEQQAELLRRSGCRLAQGWLYGRPMRSQDLCSFVRDRAQANVVAVS